MVAPYTGPIVKGLSSPTYWWYRAGYRQAAPHRDVLPCTYFNAAVQRGYGNPDHGENAPSRAYGPNAWNEAYGSQIIAASNKARAGFSESAFTKVNLSVDLAEYHQSIDMITGRAKQLVEVIHSVRKKDFGRFLRAIDPRGQKAMKGRKPTWKKSFSDNFLEVHFGWSPLMGDIHDAAHAISEPLSSTKIVKTAHAPISWSNRFDAGSGYFNFDYGEGSVRTRVSAYVKCTNPALHLASSLGLTNPLALAWETIPFSFVVDWFTNVGQFVSQMDEFAGLEFINPCTTQFYSQKGSTSFGNPNWNPPVQSTDWTNVCMQRTPGIPSVSLEMPNLKLPSPSRALTAISLMIQKLGK